MATRNYLAYDHGASSGRALLGTFDGSHLTLKEVHRFHNGPVRMLDTLYWDLPRLWSEMTLGLRIARDLGAEISSVGCDTWGVDFGLLDKNNGLIGSPVHYRDSRTDGVMERLFETVPRERVFEETGIQFMKFNTLYQLYAMVLAGSPQLKIASRFLMVSDLFNYLLSGRSVCEFSNATTTQFYNPRKKTWAKEMLEKLGIPTEMLPEIVPSGTVLGNLLPSVAEEAGLPPGIPVIAPACHDTGSAVAAVPAEGSNYAYLSSGTWSLMGIESETPIISEQSLAYNFTNEGGVGGRIRFLKNIMGLWLIQECRREWADAGEKHDWGELVKMAEAARPFACLVDVDDESFLSPGDMPARIRDYAKKTGQPVPETKGAVIRCALESLALKYRQVFLGLEDVRGEKIEVLHIVGGGCQNALLNRFTANALERPVVAGPIEATALGNIAVQAVALGDLGSLQDARKVIRESFESEAFEPEDSERWLEAYGRFQEIRKRFS